MRESSLAFAKNLKRRKLCANLKRDKYLYIMLAPMLLYFLLFSYLPMWGITIAFKDYSLFRGIMNSPWVGLENFRDFFTGPYFFRTLKNTLLLNFYDILFSFPAPILLALMLNELSNGRYRKITQTSTYIPHFISTVVVAGIVSNFLAPSNGLINLLIEMLGGEKKYCLAQPQYFRTIYVAMNVWKTVGFGSIVYVAALTGVDHSLYEAATIDGAGKLRQIVSVTLPAIMPTIVIMFIIRLGNILKTGYESILLLYQPSTYPTADVIGTYVYRTGLISGDYKLATAVGVFDSVVAIVLTFLANTLSRKATDTSLW